MLLFLSFMFEKRIKMIFFLRKVETGTCKNTLKLMLRVGDTL
jgi:hypothetical protein